MEKEDKDEMHRIANAYQAGARLLALDEAWGTAMVEAALTDAYRLGVRDTGGDPDRVPERFLADWELWQAWRFGVAVQEHAPLDMPVYVIGSRASFALRARLFGARMGVCVWPRQAGAQARAVQVEEGTALWGGAFP